MVTNVRALTLKDIIQVDNMAWTIAQQYQEWEMLRLRAATKWDEIREYLFATDTHTTSNAVLPWKNSTHLPKLCQIRDNLHANYIAALFPNADYVTWTGDDESAASKEKRQAIEAYMQNKLRTGGFETVMSKCLLDWIDYGNCFAMTEYIDERITDPVTKEVTPGYVGPKAVRISPLDIVFNPAAATFEESPKIIRSIKTLGSLKADIQDHPEYQFYSDVFDKVLKGRHAFRGMAQSDFSKNEEFNFAGFSNWYQYFQSDYIEVLDFYGDYYDVKTQKFYKNAIITVVDRSYVIRNVQNPSWLGTSPIKHCGWRLRQDNLYAMGPLDNLVGMQYRIDHLENAKADAVDLIVVPMQKVKGYVEDYEYGPGERIYVGDDGDVEFMHPDVTFLQADTQIQQYSAAMEEMAGAPKQAMGFRTPGEKTAFEVQMLENGANRVFVNKTNYFEEVFEEPLLNDMLETARRNMSASDTIRVMDDQYGVEGFLQVTKEDISAKGKIYPVGSRRFLKNSNMVQNLVQMYNSALGQDPTIKVHWSGKLLAQLMEQLLGLEKYNLYGENVRVYEQAETQQIMQAAQQRLGEQAQAVANQAGGQPPQVAPDEQTRADILQQRQTALSTHQGEA